MNKLLTDKLSCQYFEGMACQNGCINGPGSLADSNLVNVLVKKYAATAGVKKISDDTTAVEAVHKVHMEVW